METDELILDEKAERLPQKTGNDLIRMLKNNPDIPDFLREVAPFLSFQTRKNVVRLAAAGDFLMRLSESPDFGINGKAEPQPVSELYGAVKKYIPMNKRQTVDAVMGALEMLRTKMQPKYSRNGLESVINGLTKINELSKIVSGAGAVKKLQESNSLDLGSMLDFIGNAVGKDKMDRMTEMIGKIVGSDG